MDKPKFAKANEGNARRQVEGTHSHTQVADEDGGNGLGSRTRTVQSYSEQLVSRGHANGNGPTLHSMETHFPTDEYRPEPFPLSATDSLYSQLKTTK